MWIWMGTETGAWCLYDDVGFTEPESSLERAFVDFVLEAYAGLVRTGCLLTGDRGHAEDLVQQSLLATFHSWRRRGLITNAEAYTRVTMVRLAGRWRRRRWSREVPTCAIPERATDDHAADVDLAALVHSALASLPWPQRAVLVLRYYDDLSENEIASILRCSVGTVKSRASRALAALRTTGVLADVSPAGPDHDHREAGERR
jgi:RNA polymerase sigma-70 factor (sigma-E family)